MPIFLHTNRVFITTHPVEFLVDMVCIYFHINSFDLINDFLSFIAVKILGWGEEDSTPYWLVANCKLIYLLGTFIIMKLVFFLLMNFNFFFRSLIIFFSSYFIV
jgi:hypothetical protein